VSSDEAVIALLDALDALAISYVLTGSLASNFHGVPRSTRDADIVVALPPGGLERLAEALPPELTLDAQGAFETVTGTTRHVVRLRDSVFVLELFLLSDDPHDVERFARRLRVQALGRHIWVPAVEDVVVTKLRWAAGGGRAKDVEDVRNVLAVSGEHVDWTYVRDWCAQHGTTALLEQVLQSLR
jgi:hypothetical protein